MKPKPKSLQFFNRARRIVKKLHVLKPRLHELESFKPEVITTAEIEERRVLRTKIHDLINRQKELNRDGFFAEMPVLSVNN